MNKKYFISNEILDTIDSLKIKNINQGWFDNKPKDERSISFFSYEKIRKSINSEEKIEDYFRKINIAIEGYKRFITSKEKCTFIYDFALINSRLKESKTLLERVYRILKIQNDIPDLKISPLTKDISVYVDDQLKDSILTLLSKLSELTQKVFLFAKSNNYYGDAYRKPYSFVKNEKEIDYRIIEKMTNEIEKLLNKKLVADFFDDGSKVFSEMMPTIFSCFDILSKIKKNKDVSEEKLINEDICIKINKELENIYSFLDNKINKEYLLLFNENDLNRMLEKITELCCGIDFSKPVYTIYGYGETMLNSLIGLSSIKKTVRKIREYYKTNKNDKNFNIHMCFLGNPGSGKTEVARIMAQILFDNKVLPSNKIIETDRSGLVGEYLGETAIKTQAIIDKAMGKVLFIDEAYSLVSSDSSYDYGHEAIATLIKNMEDRRGKFCVILAGYKNKMEEMLNTNPGFKSRIQFNLDFPNYQRDELEEILSMMLKNRGYTIEKEANDRILDITDILRKNPNFANAREIRNILDQTIMCVNVRDNQSREITLADVERYIDDNNLNLPTKQGEKNILSPYEELDNLIGLEKVKDTIKKIRAFIIKNKNEKLNLHMCFSGNPGTGKTEVARIISRILYDIKALKEAKLMEVGPNDLVSPYSGESGIKTKRVIDDATDGVLFIDEAYGLLDSGKSGSDSINTLIKEMEDKRGKICCIFAGYQENINELLASNPGFKSRIQFRLEFPDFSREELTQIAIKMLNSKNLKITNDALKGVIDIVELERKKPSFANARTLRNILDKIVMNYSLRTVSIDNDNTIIYQDVEEYIRENNLIELSSSSNETIERLYKLYENYDQNIVDESYLEQTVISISGSNSQSTGFIISNDGLCLTCSHCISEDYENQIARIVFNLGKKKIKTYSSFSLIKRDEINDLALIKLQLDNDYDYIALENAEYEYKPLGEFLMAGYPFGGETFSTISITEGKIASVNVFRGRDVVFADMFGKPGNSGSPIIDKSTKKVIGVFWGGISQGNEIINCFTHIKVILKLLKS